MRMHPRTLRGGRCQRSEETPLEIEVAVCAVLVGVLTLVTSWSILPVWYLALVACLALGGATVAAGRVVDRPNVESIGLVLLLGAYLCLVLRSLAHAHGLAEVLSVTFNAAALAFGFGVRLVVVRKAVVARSWAGRRANDG